jgi:hypothetical protein
MKRKQPSHSIPAWTFIATPIALAIPLLMPWKELKHAYPDAEGLMLTSIAICMALVLISMSHWLRAVTKR